MNRRLVLRFCGAMGVAALLFGSFPAGAQNGEPCRFADIGRGVAAAAVDARSIRLADGREVVLAGLAFGQEAGATAALDAMVRGQPVTLRGPSAATDRYGRLSAFVFVNASETPVQYALLERGLAQAGVQRGGKACQTALVAREQAARKARLGLFADPRYAILAPDDAELQSRQGRFAVVQGKVFSVRQTAGTTYINFGRRWSETLSVAIPRRHDAAFAKAGLAPREFEGRMLRVRGYVEARTGPVIEAGDPDQIEIVQDR